MTEVYAPYHFVPLSKWIYMPEWAHLVSHDFPFQDGYCGVLEYTLTNHTPLCVGSNKKEVNNKQVLQFARNPLGEPIIPGSSLKGMIRNVLEIASFGKFNSVDDNQFAYRNFDDPHYKGLMTTPNDKFKKLSKSGWIKFLNGKWQYLSCAHHRVFNSTLNDHFDSSIKNDTSDRNASTTEQTILDKYRQIPLRKDNQNIGICFDIEKITMEGTNGKEVTLKHAVIGKEGALFGIPVFTGFRPGKKKYRHNRLSFSYLFEAPDQKAKPQCVDEKIVQAFFDNHDQKTIDYLKKHDHKEFGIPVFALYAGNKLHSLGLSQMPRINYETGIYSLIKNHSNLHSDPAVFDMAELMFGTLRDKGLGLKSRVFFSDAVITSDYSENDFFQGGPTVLGQPQASFQSGYLEQNSSEFQNYNNKEAKVSGWKRYPARKDFENNPPPNNNDKTAQYFELLKIDHEFKGKIVFNNLKKEELAALIWCISINNSPYNHHSLGHAKPLGAGTVSVKLQESSFAKTNSDEKIAIDINAFCQEFAEHMNTRQGLDGKWSESVQIKHLLALTDEDIENFNDFRYMKLDGYQDANKNKMALPALDLNGSPLAREDKAKSFLSSPAFGKGRLSALFDTENQIHKIAQEEAAQYQVLVAEREAKAAAIKKLQNLAEQPPFERMLGTLENLLENQEAISKSKTEKKKAEKDINGFTQEAKDLALSKEQAQQLTNILKQFTFADKFTKKFIKLLDTI